MNDSLATACILVVDDEPANLLFMERLLARAGCTRVHSTADARQAIPLFEATRPDLVLLDLHLPHIDGFQLLRELCERIGDDYLPVLVLTADATSQAKERALGGGASDFLTKPLDAVEVLLRIRNLLETRRLHAQLRERNLWLEERVRERTRALEEAREEILERLARAADFRDDATGRHARRVGELSRQLALRLGCDAEVAELIGSAAPLHDLGKIGVPDAILLKPHALSADEYEVLRTHALIGASILAGSRHPQLRVAEVIALSHHEHWDGSGYPNGHAGEQIPLAGRIVAVVDAFDAMTRARPYKAAWPVARALAELVAGRGTQFDPAVVDAFLEMVPAEG